MFKSINDIRLVQFEPQLHIVNFLEWYYSGDYSEFFRGTTQIPSVENFSKMLIGKTFMVLKEEHIIGAIMFFNMDEIARRCEVGLMIDKKFEKNGDGVKAFKVFLYWLFNSLNLYKVTVEVMSRNKRLNDILHKMGAVDDGSPAKNHLYLDGEFHNVNRWAMFKGDYNKRYKRELEHGQTESTTVTTVSGGAVWPTGSTPVNHGNGEPDRSKPTTHEGIRAIS